LDDAGEAVVRLDCWASVPDPAASPSVDGVRRGEHEDRCASEIEMGICHAACLEGSPVVNLETGEPIEGGTVDTWRYGDDPLLAFLNATTPPPQVNVEASHDA
jgi:hypothetical protein